MILPGIDLLKEGTSIGVQDWNGDMDHFGELQPAWVQILGIPPKWCTWKVLTQVVLCFDVLVEVDWGTIFKSFYEEARVKVLCRDQSKIPGSRIVEMKHKLYLLYMEVEQETQEKKDEADDKGDNDDDEDDGKDSHKNSDDEANDLDEMDQTGNMGTDRNDNTSPKGDVQGTNQSKSRLHGNGSMKQMDKEYLEIETDTREQQSSEECVQLL